MYLAVLTRPNIAFSVSFLSQFNNSYTESHWKCAKRILRYLHLLLQMNDGKQNELSCTVGAILYFDR